MYICFVIASKPTGNKFTNSCKRQKTVPMQGGQREISVACDDGSFSFPKECETKCSCKTEEVALNCPSERGTSKAEGVKYKPSL